MPTDTGIRYHWFRSSKILLSIFALYEIIVLLMGFFYEADVAFWFLLIGGFFIIGLFHSMQVTVYRESLYISFGIGLFTREIGFGELEYFKIIPNKSLIPFLFSPTAEHSLEVYLRNGKKITLPCDDARQLMEILKVPL